MKYQTTEGQRAVYRAAIVLLDEVYTERDVVRRDCLIGLVGAMAQYLETDNGTRTVPTGVE